MSRTAPLRPMIVLPADPAAMRIGGIASFVRSFVKFAPDDVEVSMIGVSAELPTWTWTTVEMEGRPMRFLSALRASTERRSRVPLAWRFTASVLRHRRQIRTAGHVVNFHRPATDLAVPGSLAPRVRYVHLTTADLTTAGSESRWRRLGSVLDAVERRSFGAMDLVYVVNSEAAAGYRKRWPEVADRIRFVPNWYDGSIFRPLPVADRDAARLSTFARHGIPGDVRMVLFAGRLEGQKSPLLLVEAFASARAAEPAVLVIAGDGSLRQAVERRVGELGLGPGVRFVSTQARTELNQLMNAASCLVISSEFETGPTVGYEALATGLPIVTTPVGEIGRIVAESGSGAVANDHSPAALARAIDAVLRGPAGDLRAGAIAAAEPYSAERVLAGLYADQRELASFR